MEHKTARVLVVDDERSVRDSLQKWLQMDGYEVAIAEDGQAALCRLQAEAYDVALVDLKMPGIDGVELHRRIARHAPQTAVIIFTAYATVETAVEVMKRGAFDYLTKPVDPDHLSRVIRQAVSERQACDAGPQPGALAAVVVGDAPAIVRARELADQAAAADQPLVIDGEPGTGRRLLAAAVHARSARRLLELAPVDCDGIEGDELATQLLGRAGEGGRRGKLELATGGTLLLVGLDGLGLRAQARLLELLDQPPRHDNPPDPRLIATSARGLAALRDEGRLRDDLCYRLDVLRIHLPPLRERPGDIPKLARHLIARGGATAEPAPRLSERATRALLARRWPGNIAELRSVLERAVARARGTSQELDLEHLDPSDAPG